MFTIENRERSGLEMASDAAGKVHGAIKTGRAVAAALRGATAGGPYGAAVGAALAAGKPLGKAIAAAALLMLPLLFILMLPSLIFGGLAASATAAQPVLNDSAAISENMANAAFGVNEVLDEGIEDVKTRIAGHFAGTDGDHYEIINPYENSVMSNISILIGQYCAAKEQDWQTISLADLKQVLRNGKSRLYSYTFTVEEWETADDDPDTPDVIEMKTEKWYIYTIVYNGEDYFADNVFSLDDEQKLLARNYAENLSLFLGDGMLQYAPGNGEFTIPALGNITFTDGSTPVVYYSQLDPAYANQPFGTDDIGGYGCGPTSMAIVVSSLTNERMDPAQMARWAYENGYWCSRSGSYHSLIPGAAQHWGLTVEGCTAAEPQRIVDALSSGKLVVALMGPGHFTRSGHFMVLRGVQNGEILIANPANYDHCQRTWDLSIILGEASKMASAGGPFWIISRQSSLPDAELAASADSAKLARLKSEHPAAGRIYEFLSLRGYADPVIAGILGNMMAECGGQTLDLNWSLYDSSGDYYGLCMWSLRYGPQVRGADLDGQMNYLAGNIRQNMRQFGGDYDYFMRMQDPGVAAQYFCTYYERGAGASVRAQNAYKALTWING